MITANQWIRTNAPSLHALEQEMSEYEKVQAKAERRGTCFIKAPDGYTTIVTKRFAEWFLERNADWSLV